MAIVVREKMLSEYNGHLQSVMVTDGTDNIDVTNGVFVTMENTLKAVEFPGEIHEAQLTGSGDHTKEIYLIDTPVVHYDQSRKVLKDSWVNKAGKPARAFALANGDYIALTEGLFNDAPAVGDVFVAGADGHLTKGDQADAIIKFVVIEAQGRKVTQEEDAYAVRVVR